MRTKPLVGTKPWFGPRSWFGWGWTPMSWEGWAVLGVFLVAVLVTREPAGTFVWVPALIAVCWLKGTSPGGPAARRRLQIERERDEWEHRADRS
jgi:hypothetical protein